MVLLLSSALRSQDSSLISVGDRLRASFPFDDSVPEILREKQRSRTAVAVGALVRWDKDSIRLQSERLGSEWSIPVRKLNTVQVYRGLKSRADDGFLYGTLIGLAAGIALFVETQSTPCSGDFFGGCLFGGGDTFVEELGLAKIGLATVLGAGLGALVGSAFTKDRWENIPPRAWP